MAVLIAPDPRWQSSWLEAHAEWGPGVHEDGFGLLSGDDISSGVGFASWIRRLSDDEDCTYWWIADNEDVLGGIALRSGSHPLAPRAGHVGFGIRPSARGRGLAAWALGRVIEHAGVHGVDRVLGVCAADNGASAGVLERQGGVLEKGSRDGSVLRYWIRTTRTAAAGAESRSR